MFYRLKNKTHAREELVRMYRDLTGRQGLRPDGQYWTLCGTQTARNSELRQLCHLGLLVDAQFHGVDFDPKIIGKNRRIFPQAHWYAGSWSSVIRTLEFRPEVVYLDTMNVVGLAPARRIIKETIFQCPKGTILFINLMQTNPYSGYNRAPNDEEVLNNIEQDIPPEILSYWEDTGKHYVYSATSITRMATYVLRRVR